jgi:hypothetical protein
MMQAVGTAVIQTAEGLPVFCSGGIHFPQPSVQYGSVFILDIDDIPFSTMIFVPSLVGLV